MKALKRIVYLIGFIPIMLIGCVYWIFTGKEATDPHDQFEKWIDN